MQTSDDKMTIMRTTVTINDDLLARAKALAATQRRTLGAVLDDALRAHLDWTDAPREPITLPVFRDCTGLAPGVDLGDKEQIADLLGDNEVPSWL